MIIIGEDECRPVKIIDEIDRTHGRSKTMSTGYGNDFHLSRFSLQILVQKIII